MLTEREVIKMLERSLAMLDDRNKTQKEHNLSDDDFYPYMAGYLSGDIVCCEKPCISADSVFHAR